MRLKMLISDWSGLISITICELSFSLNCVLADSVVFYETRVTLHLVLCWCNCVNIDSHPTL